MTKEACRPPKCSSPVRIHKTKKHHSTPTPSLSREGNRPREGAKVARGNTASGQKKWRLAPGSAPRGSRAGRASRRLPHPLTRGRSQVCNPQPRRLTFRQPGSASLLFPAGRWRLCPARPPARRSRCRPAAGSAGLSAGPSRGRARAALGSGAHRPMARRLLPAPPRPATPRPRRPRAAAPCLPFAHPSQPRSVCCSFRALTVLPPGLLQRT